MSLLTKAKPESELVGLVYGATEIPREDRVPLYERPAFWAIAVTAVFAVLNIYFW